MTDILVTTPKSEIPNAAQEALNCIENNGGYYFRYFSKPPKRLDIGDRVFYVEEGYIRGFATVYQIKSGKYMCETTGKMWPNGNYVFMSADSWKWIDPILHQGFQGFRYLNDIEFEIVGDWKDPKPRIK